jgi:hypothetical protein
LLAPRDFWRRPLSVGTCPLAMTYKANAVWTRPFPAIEGMFFDPPSFMEPTEPAAGRCVGQLVMTHPAPALWQVPAAGSSPRRLGRVDLLATCNSNQGARESSHDRFGRRRCPRAGAIDRRGDCLPTAWALPLKKRTAALPAHRWGNATYLSECAEGQHEVACGTSRRCREPYEGFHC